MTYEFDDVFNAFAGAQIGEFGGQIWTRIAGVMAHPVEVSADTLCPDMIAETIRSEGHFLGHPQTFGRMKSDFLYPDLADRRPIADWEAAGAPDIRERAKEVAKTILAAHFPPTLDEATDASLRREFDIRLPHSRMQSR